MAVTSQSVKSQVFGYAWHVTAVTWLNSLAAHENSVYLTMGPTPPRLSISFNFEFSNTTLSSDVPEPHYFSMFHRYVVLLLVFMIITVKPDKFRCMFRPHVCWILRTSRFPLTWELGEFLELLCLPQLRNASARYSRIPGKDFHSRAHSWKSLVKGKCGQLYGTLISSQNHKLQLWNILFMLFFPAQRIPSLNISCLINVLMKLCAYSLVVSVILCALIIMTVVSLGQGYRDFFKSHLLTL